MNLFVIGTRPEAIKMCPIILEFLKKDSSNVKVCLTGQHGDLVYDVLKIFKVKYDYDLKIMKKNQTLAYVISSIINKLSNVFKQEKIDYIFVHGDTTTAMASALAAFQHKIKIVHIEAGLRTKTINLPFPEESNRRIISTISDISFCPTQENLKNLKKENNKSLKFVVGNSIIDSLKYVKENYNNLSTNKTEEYILLTTHRRENIGKNMKQIFQAMDYISKKYKILVKFPIHPNPIIREIFNKEVIANEYFELLEPQNYINFSILMINSKMIITDSGGIQEEGSYLGKPILVLRNNTERQEAIENGNAILVGSSKNKIIKTIESILNDKKLIDSFKEKKSPYGNGDTSTKIYEIFSKIL